MKKKFYYVMDDNGNKNECYAELNEDEKVIIFYEFQGSYDSAIPYSELHEEDIEIGLTIEEFFDEMIPDGGEADLEF